MLTFSSHIIGVILHKSSSALCWGAMAAGRYCSSSSSSTQGCCQNLFCGVTLVTCVCPWLLVCRVLRQPRKLDAQQQHTEVNMRQMGSQHQQHFAVTATVVAQAQLLWYAVCKTVLVILLVPRRCCWPSTQYVLLLSHLCTEAAGCVAVITACLVEVLDGTQIRLS